uniref:Uncharacterized protein n=1 Tax=Eutreptiella gymnastica TaxID=73025 RepID=A0A7S1J7Y7_9EUGL
MWMEPGISATRHAHSLPNTIPQPRAVRTEPSTLSLALGNPRHPSGQRLYYQVEATPTQEKPPLRKKRSRNRPICAVNPITKYLLLCPAPVPALAPSGVKQLCVSET